MFFMDDVHHTLPYPTLPYPTPYPNIYKKIMFNIP